MRAPGQDVLVRRRRLATVLLVLALSLPGCVQIPAGSAASTTLIDGSSGLENWHRIGDANWRVEEGAIVADRGKGGYLVSRNSYSDFEVRAEFRADPATNSGIFLRLSDPEKVSSRNAYEVNIRDEVDSKGYGTGSIVNLASASPAIQAGGRWNTFEITARGNRLKVVLNGIPTAVVEDGRFTRGPLALQYRGGRIMWRKVQVRELPQ